MKQCSECKEWFGLTDGRWVIVFAHPKSIVVAPVSMPVHAHANGEVFVTCGAECAIKAMSKAIGNLVS